MANEIKSRLLKWLAERAEGFSAVAHCASVRLQAEAQRCEAVPYVAAPPEMHCRFCPARRPWHSFGAEHVGECYFVRCGSCGAQGPLASSPEEAFAAYALGSQLG